MNLRDLEYLVALAEHRHFGRAANACLVSQPTLSTQLKKLESHLGVPLIERGPRQVLLTSAGEQIVSRARAILIEADGIRGIARQARDPRAGTVRLGAFPTLAPYLFPHVVPALHTELPDLELLLVEEKTDDLLVALTDGRLDAAVLALPIELDGLHREPLFREDFVLAVPAGHRLAVAGAADEPVPATVLAGEPLLLLADGHCLRAQALSVCQQFGGSERAGFRATSLETLRMMVAAGVGITLLPELAVRAPVAASEAIVLRRFRDPVPHRDIALVWRRTSSFAPLLSDVATILRRLPAGYVRPLVTPSPSSTS
ncbi:MAG: LysR family transcriptional regulator [Austwickia sp.]|jgi:LysR family hydrogen peroxide-inducible transcriptional activator|nr:LysR family transcriptional regulator [Austwickia sp.]MBK8436314.1 LysR family transcriptional regulator [Austwickia sp.]MBK9101992.1 LysR family transcriptional regulator [Austwickia sp.]